MDISIRDRRKIIKVLSGILLMALAVMLMLNTIPASASGAGSGATTGKYSKLTVNATATSLADMTSRSKMTNTGSAKRYATVSIKTYKNGVFQESESSSGNVAVNSTLSSPSKSCPQTHTVKGYSTIHSGTSKSTTTLETLSVTAK